MTTDEANKIIAESSEKTYNLLELEEGEEYACDEAVFGNARFKIAGFTLLYVDETGVTKVCEKPLYFKTFRKIKKELTFSDLVKCEKYTNGKHEGQFICIYEDHAIFWIKKHLCSMSVHSNNIKGWRKVK